MLYLGLLTEGFVGSSPTSGANIFSYLPSRHLSRLVQLGRYQNQVRRPKDPLCSRLRMNFSGTVTKTVTVTKKKSNPNELDFLEVLDSLDWCGGGDLNPYALRR